MIRKITVLLWTVTVLESSTIQAEEVPEECVVTDFKGKLDFAYLSFQEGASTDNGTLHIMAPNGRGGVGFNQALDLSRFGERTPVLHLKVGPQNKAAAIVMFFATGDEKRMFRYDLSSVGLDAFVPVAADHALALSPESAGEPDATFDPSDIRTFQVQGDWRDAAVDVYVDRIALVSPTESMRAIRQTHIADLVKRKLQREKQEEERRRQVEALIASAPHPADGPDVQHVAPVARNMLGITIQAGDVVRRKQVSYQPQEGDVIRPEKNTPDVLYWEGGKIVDGPKGWELWRPDNRGREKRIGTFVANQNLVSPGPEFRGIKASEVTLGVARAYRIRSADDAAYDPPRQPTAVHRKSKPTAQNGANEMAVRHTVYLELPAPLKENATYTIDFVGVNTRQESIVYRHRPRAIRSEAVHVSHIGFRPDDPFKRAYLSLWAGTGGALTYDVNRFELIDDANGQTVYRGDVLLGFAADKKESIRGGKNHTQTNVYYLDFHEFRRSGTYRIFVPGIGTSYPFEIGDGVWSRAFEVSMHGFLSHRSGIALGHPFTSYVRPRPKHPDDGVKVFELDVTFWNGEAAAVLRSLRRLLGPGLDEGKVKVHSAAWGGYMDAGDWDRRSQHLTATWEQLELADLFPEFFRSLKLALPPEEAGDLIPDIINEALWNLDCYRRLQRSHGGVGGGIESTSHPRSGEASWQESLLLGTFAPDPETSLRYAACAAKAARLLSAYDKALASVYSKSSVRAWNWALDNTDRVLAEEAKRAREDGNEKWKDKSGAVRTARALAAVALYRLTRDAKYHEAFNSATALRGGDTAEQLRATFAYASLPDHLGDTELKAQARNWFVEAADQCVAFGKDNAFNIACRVPNLPVIGYVAYYSVPETSIGPILPRAYHLTGDERYLRAAIAAAQFSAGANPMNMTMTIGVGHDYPKQPLHVDANHAGIDPPRGITVYGPTDPALSLGYTAWAHTWYLGPTMVPDSRTWPTTESYVDLSNWPVMTEYTVHQCFRPTSYYWGFLAARASN